jgi:hypothetical protein
VAAPNPAVAAPKAPASKQPAINCLSFMRCGPLRVGVADAYPAAVVPKRLVREMPFAPRASEVTFVNLPNGLVRFGAQLRHRNSEEINRDASTPHLQSPPRNALTALTKSGYRWIEAKIS